MNDSSARDKWSGRMAFVMAAAASAVGLGNIWRFPYLAAKYGGGIFLLVYVALAVTIGFTLMTVEIAIGRRTKLSPLDAYKSIAPKWQIIGWLGMAVPALIIAYYSVIGGWIVKFLAFYAKRLFEASPCPVTVAESKALFSDFTGGGSLQPLACSAVFAFCTAVLVLLGVRRGIEKSNKIAMPLLLVLCVAVAAMSLCQPGAAEGLAYYLKPDFSKFSWKTVVWALGQMFFSLSLAMGIMVTYGSYMRKEDSIPKCVFRIEFFDALVAFLAGLMIIPPVFTFLGEEGLKSEGPGLMFISLPGVFGKMTLFGASIGDVAGLLFFALAFFAALTSSVSIMETVVSSLRDRLGLGRTAAGMIVTIYMFITLVPNSLCFANDGVFSCEILPGMRLLDFCDFAANNIFMPLCAFLTCVFAGWCIGPNWIVREIGIREGRFRLARPFAFMVKYAAPAAIALIFTFYILKELKIVEM